MVSVEYIDATLDPSLNSGDLYGVVISIYIYDPNHDGGTVKITWGSYETETFPIADYGLQDGQNKIGNALPLGTHNICAEVV